MAATINTNIASINAQRNLSLSGQSLNTTMQRLSSGLRVNSAKDDAAGLAIAERMNTQVKGLTVASRNANDGISLAQTAEGSLGKIGDMLQRQRELAVQASNATNSDSDRAALQAEVSQLSAEIDRVAKQTNFNGQKILDGSFAGAVFQVGANSGDNVTLGALADTRSSKLSIVNYAQNTVSFDVNDTPTPAIKDYAVAIPAGELKISIGSTPPQTIELDAIKPATSSLERLGQVVTAINSKSTDTGVTAYMSRNAVTGDYDIQIMSEKTTAEGKPLRVSFDKFTEATTGIGVPTNSPYKTLAAITPTSATATPAVTVVPADFNGTATNPIGTDPTLPPSISDYIANIQALNLAFPDSPPYPADKVTALDDAINDFNDLTTTSTEQEANAVFAALRAALQDTGLTGVNVDDLNAKITANNDAFAAGTPNQILASLSESSTPAEFETAVQHLQTYGLNLGDASKGGFDLTSYYLDPTAPTATAAWSNEAGHTVKDALTDLQAFASAFASGGLNMAPDDNFENQRGLDAIDVTTQEGAWVALKKIDSAIDQINGARATLGAMQTRFETAVNNIDIQVENLSAARGRIMDADFAVETANLSRTQILQQAGTAMVAQANQIPQNVLQLLQS
ncbi:flagellin [Comamonas aquatica]|uniref:flagellin N-terminal helical domain-containing protein n=1 Tax=Comamonas aquatica TaxID=225991 RepID=UPI00244D21B9|nr:flagellin [Comamonas aquatica]MDH0370890.1 flagellin [Comamonas aquatica]MDH1379197.1 flagellin [Comamonas aquatica]MDH1639095.1 flagellin [Comamonas aquatica]